ncbi:MAG: aminocarboxymuconate-semialdehyde decarboxylase [Bradymonadia bacterium]|jgi:aminocarboxymuconate-semialdehyde decarboxylase
MKIDMHTHVLPEDWPDFREEFGYGGWIRLDHHRDGWARMMKDDTFFREINSNCWNDPCRLKDCDRDGVDVQVISTVPVMFAYWANARHAHRVSQVLNDDLAERCAAHPDRFVALASVAMQAQELAVEELTRAMALPGMRGVQIGSHVEGKNLDHEDFYGFWEACESLDAAVLVHPWDMMGMDTLPDYWLPWLVSMPAETARAMCCMMMGGILERYPKLRVCFAHGGGSFPGTLGRIMHGWQARPDLCQTRTKTPPSDLLDRVYIDSAVHDERSLRWVMDVMGADRIMMGSDYPFPLGEAHPGKMIEDMKLDSAVQDRLLAGSALEWLGMTAADFSRGGA